MQVDVVLVDQDEQVSRFDGRRAVHLRRFGRLYDLFDRRFVGRRLILEHRWRPRTERRLLLRSVGAAASAHLAAGALFKFAVDLPRDCSDFEHKIDRIEPVAPLCSEVGLVVEVGDSHVARRAVGPGAELAERCCDAAAVAVAADIEDIVVGLAQSFQLGGDAAFHCVQRSRPVALAEVQFIVEALECIIKPTSGPAAVEVARGDEVAARAPAGGVALDRFVVCAVRVRRRAAEQASKRIREISAVDDQGKVIGVLLHVG